MKEFDLETDVRLWEKPFDFSKRSTIGCGGLAKIAYYPQTVEQLATIVTRCEEGRTPYLVLGNLSNVLPSDEGYDGVIVSTKRLNGVTVGERVFAYAGVTPRELLSSTKRAGLGGAEFLSGIPCTMGGALYMNAGAAGRYISEIVESVLVLRDGEKLLLSAKNCEYAYKKSVFMQNEDVILGCSLLLYPSAAEEIARREKEYLERRKHLPKGRSMGCVFKNPEGRFAGALIEGCGLKGYRVGGAKISEEHANFILNDKGATAKDIRALIEVAKRAVYEKYSIHLQEEIRQI